MPTSPSLSFSNQSDETHFSITNLSTSPGCSSFSSTCRNLQPIINYNKNIALNRESLHPFNVPLISNTDNNLCSYMQSKYIPTISRFSVNQSINAHFSTNSPTTKTYFSSKLHNDDNNENYLLPIRSLNVSYAPTPVLSHVMKPIPTIDGPVNFSDLIELQPVRIMDWLAEVALLRLTNLFEIFSSSSTLSERSRQMRFATRVQNLLVQLKSIIHQNNIDANLPKQNGIWGASLSSIQARTSDSTPLPRFVHDIIDYLEQNAQFIEGIFRKNGTRTRVSEIRNCCSKLGPDQPLPTEFLTSSNFHDVAEVLKQYFRELPECLMTNRISKLMENCVIDLSETKHFAALHYCILIMPSENREALMILLKFLNKVSKHFQQNQMNAYNLATCLMPTLFKFSDSFSKIPNINAHKNGSVKHKILRRRDTIGAPSESQVHNVFDSIRIILAKMIENWEQLLKVPPNLAKEISLMDLGTNREMSMPSKSDQLIFSDEILRGFRRQQQVLIQSYNEGLKNWSLRRVFSDGTQIFTRHVNDLTSLKKFRIETNINAPVNFVLNLILQNRPLWDMNLHNWRKVKSNYSYNFDMIKVEYRTQNLVRNKHVYLARHWTYGNLSGEPSIVVERSVTPKETELSSSNERIRVFKSYFFILPVSHSESRLIYFSRADLRGKTSLWYEHTYGEMLANSFMRFKLNANCRYSFGSPKEVFGSLNKFTTFGTLV